MCLDSISRGLELATLLMAILGYFRLHATYNILRAISEPDAVVHVGYFNAFCFFDSASQVRCGDDFIISRLQ